MSDSAIIKECLVHYDNRHIQVRRDFYDLCVYDKSLFNKKINEKGKIIRDEPNQECMAKIIRLLETLTDDARKEWYTKAINARKQGLHIPNEPEEFPIKLTYGAICTLLYNTYGESTVRNSVAVLIQWGYIKWQQATINSIPRYILNTKLLQGALYQQAQERVLNLTPLQGNENEAVENNTQAVENNTQAVENNTNNKYYNKPFNKSLEKEGTSASSIDDDATLSPSFANGDDDGDHARHDDNRVVSSNNDDAVCDPQNPLEDSHGTGPAQQQTTTPTETAKLHRLTNPPESPSQQNVSTDESHARIERETENGTPSLPVIDASIAEVTHVDARKDGDSYSPQSTAKTPTPTTEQSNFGLNQPEVTKQQTETPVASGKGSGKRSGGNKKTTTPDMSPIAPPARPDPDLPFTVEKILAWGDYGRGMKLRKSTRSDSKFVKALDAARVIEGKKGLTENFFLTLYFNWMKGVSVDLTDLPEGALKSDSWPDYSVDLWVFAEHYEEEKTRYLNRKRDVERVTLKAQQLAKGIVSTATKIAGYTNQSSWDDDEEVVYQSKAEKIQRKRA